MPTDQILNLLIQERDKLNRAIEALQGGAKRRGRPPKALSDGGSVDGAVATRGPQSAAARKAASERMKKYWAAKRKTAKTAQR